MNHNRRELARIALFFLWAFLGVSFLLGYYGHLSFVLMSSDGCIACIYPSTFYTPFLSWFYVIAMIIGMVGAFWYLNAILEWLVHSVADIRRNLPTMKGCDVRYENRSNCNYLTWSHLSDWRIISDNGRDNSMGLQ